MYGHQQSVIIILTIRKSVLLSSSVRKFSIYIKMLTLVYLRKNSKLTAHVLLTVDDYIFSVACWLFDINWVSH